MGLRLGFSKRISMWPLVRGRVRVGSRGRGRVRVRVRYEADLHMTLG